MKSSLAIGFATIAIVAGGVGVEGLRDVTHPPVKPAGLDAHESHAGASLLGQFRTNSSAFLWVRADLYLHNGVEMRKLTEGELKAGIEAQTAKDDGHEKVIDEGSVVTVVPSVDRDFRGWIGDLERQTKAYRDMSGHVHNDPQKSLPLFRLMTAIDPQFIPGWVSGATIISRTRTDAGTHKSLNYLQEGLDQNPSSIAIRTEIARLHISRNSDFARAIPLLREGAELGLDHWKTLPEDEREAVADCFRWLAMSYRDTEKFEQSRYVAQVGLTLIPDDMVLTRLASPAPSILVNDDNVTSQSPKAKLPDGHFEGDGHDHDHSGHEDHD